MTLKNRFKFNASQRKSIFLGISMILIVGFTIMGLWPSINGYIASKKGDIRYLESDNPKFIAGKKQAQGKLQYFINAVEEGKCTTTHECELKTDFYGNGSHEHMWVAVSSYKKGIFYGKLDNEPVYNKNLKSGDDVEVIKEKVEDWMLSQKGEKTFAGGFTLDAFGEYKPSAYPITYSGKGSYEKSFNDMGVVYEDDGATGYLYATNKDHSVIYDTVQLYNYDSELQPKSGDTLYFVVNDPMQKIGFFYKNKFYAVFDFKNKKGSNILNSPVWESAIWKQPHDWDDSILEGLQP